MRASMISSAHDLGGQMKTQTSKSIPAMAFLLALTVPPSQLSAQSGRISGQLLYATQSSVPGATVTLENPVNGDHRRVLTDSAGRYTFPDLPIGRYTVRAE